MTAIVGIETADGVLLGADSLAADASWGADIRVTPKLLRVGDCIFGFTTSFRMGDLLRYHLVLPPAPKTRLHRYVVATVIPAIRECFKAGGFATTKEGAEAGGDFLLGVRGHLFHIASDYQVGRSSFGYDAAGVTQSALGALAATHGQEPRARLRLALEAAERHCIGVRRPWRFLAEPTS